MSTLKYPIQEFRADWDKADSLFKLLLLIDRLRLAKIRYLSVSSDRRYRNKTPPNFVVTFSAIRDD